MAAIGFAQQAFTRFALLRALYAGAKGILVGKHRGGVYVVAISAGIVVLNDAAERLLGDDNVSLNAVQAVMGGLMAANALWISFAMFGVSHISTFAFASILLAGVLLLLAATVLRSVQDSLEFTAFLYTEYSHSALLCKFFERHGHLPDIPFFRSSQSTVQPQGTGSSFTPSDLPAMPGVSRPQAGAR